MKTPGHHCAHRPTRLPFPQEEQQQTLEAKGQRPLELIVRLQHLEQQLLA